MSYDDLLLEAGNEGLIVKELPLQSGDGRCRGRRIAIRQDIPTLAKKADVLAEELGHYYTSVGRIIKQENINETKQEQTARLWAYNKRIGLSGIINAYKAHCTSTYEIADYLGVSETFLIEALDRYRQIYGRGIMLDNYMIHFEPTLRIFEYNYL